MYNYKKRRLFSESESNSIGFYLESYLEWKLFFNELASFQNDEHSYSF